MQPDYDNMFANQAEKYDRLVAAEDFRATLYARSPQWAS